MNGYQFYWIRLRSALTLSMNISISRFWVMHVFYHSLIICSSWTKHITFHAATVLALVIESVLSHRVCTFSPGLRVSGGPSVAEFANQFFLYKASRVRPHKVKPNRADHCHSGQDHTGSGYTGPSIQSIKGGPASIKHQGPSIQIIRATNYQSIRSSKHQASGAFYAKHQGWTHKLTPCASKHQGPSIPFIKASNHQSIKHQGPSIQNIKGGPANWHLVLSGSLT